MLDFLKWLLRKHERSKDAARQRLQLILVMDRIGMMPEVVEAMKEEIIEAVSKYMVVDGESIEMEITRSGETIVLVSNIQVKEVLRTFSVHS
jgi:cell division topological specificity factor